MMEGNSFQQRAKRFAGSSFPAAPQYHSTTGRDAQNQTTKQPSQKTNQPKGTSNEIPNKGNRTNR